MAHGKRIAFLTVEDWKLGIRAFDEKVVEFEWHLGMSWQQKQKSSLSMLAQLKSEGYKPIEISRRSEDLDFGVQLSAFNLKLNNYNVENIFQAYKVCNDGGPYLDLLKVEPQKARGDCRIQTSESKKPCQFNHVEYKNKSFYNSENICEYCRTRSERHLVSFSSGKVHWGIEPKSLFYDAVYISALLQNKHLSDCLVEYNAFTDIEFNQKVPYSQNKGPFNCQARSCAIFSTLKKANYSNEQISAIVRSPEKMYSLYGKQELNFEQQTLL